MVSLIFFYSFPNLFSNIWSYMKVVYIFFSSSWLVYLYLCNFSPSSCHNDPIIGLLFPSERRISHARPLLKVLYIRWICLPGIYLVLATKLIYTEWVYQEGSSLVHVIRRIVSYIFFFFFCCCVCVRARACVSVFLSLFPLFCQMTSLFHIILPLDLNCPGGESTFFFFVFNHELSLSQRSKNSWNGKRIISLSAFQGVD